MQSESQSLWFCLAGFDLFIRSVQATVCERLTFAGSATKEKREKMLFATARNHHSSSTHLGSLSGSEEQPRPRLLLKLALASESD